MHNNSQGKKKEVEDHSRSVKLSKNKTSVTACNDSLNAKTLNVKSVSAMCDKCVLIDKHDMCVLKSVDKPLKETVASESKSNLETLPGSYMSVLVRHVVGGIPSLHHQDTYGNLSVPLSQILHCLLILLQLIEIVLFIVHSGCSKHMTGNLKLLINFVEKFLGTVKFRNDQIKPILRYGDLVQGAVTIKRVYYVEGLNHNLFFVGQFCDADLEVAFRKTTYFIRDLKGNDLLTGSRGTDLYSITLQDTNSPNPICLMAKATSSQAWLWHRRLSHLNFDTINLLSKNDIVVGLPKLKFIKDHLCSSSSINGKRYVLVIVDDYSRYTWTHFLRSKDDTPEVLIDFLRLIQRGLQAQVRVTMVLEHGSLSPGRNCPENVSHGDKTGTTSNELDLLFSLMFDELLNGSSKVVSKSSAVSATDAPNQCQQPTTPLNNHTTPVPTCQNPPITTSVISSENINQAEPHAENDEGADDEFINIFSTPVQDKGETSSRHVDSLNMHTFYQRYPSEQRWTKDHPLEQVIGNPSQSIRRLFIAYAAHKSFTIYQMDAEV
nr:hypothetical protein [Tanacetum cinerariifolium]